MSFPTLNIGDLIAKTPIVQGGMDFCRQIAMHGQLIIDKISDF